MAKAELLLSEFVNRAADLAEAVKKNVKKDMTITTETVIALNEFIIAANAAAYLTDQLNTNNMKLN